MFELRFELNGKRVDPKNVGDALESAVLDHIRETITKQVGSVRCPEHHSAAKIIAKGNNLSNLSFNISGCCQKLIDAVQAKLK